MADTHTEGETMKIQYADGTRRKPRDPHEVLTDVRTGAGVAYVTRLDDEAADQALADIDAEECPDTPREESRRMIERLRDSEPAERRLTVRICYASGCAPYTSCGVEMAAAATHVAARDSRAPAARLLLALWSPDGQPRDPDCEDPCVVGTEDGQWVRTADNQDGPDDETTVDTWAL